LNEYINKQLTILIINENQLTLKVQTFFFVLDPLAIFLSIPQATMWAWWQLSILVVEVLAGRESIANLGYSTPSSEFKQQIHGI